MKGWKCSNFRIDFSLSIILSGVAQTKSIERQKLDKRQPQLHVVHHARQRGSGDRVVAEQPYMLYKELNSGI